MSDSTEDIRERLRSQFYQVAQELSAIDLRDLQQENEMLRKESRALKERIEGLEAENYQLKMSQYDSVWKQRAEMLYEEVLRLRSGK